MIKLAATVHRIKESINFHEGWKRDFI